MREFPDCVLNCEAKVGEMLSATKPVYLTAFAILGAVVQEFSRTTAFCQEVPA